jgi:hypothetical protein
MEQKLNLSDIIDKAIESIRFIYNPENEYGLTEFHSYFKLTNGTIFDLPDYDDEIMVYLNDDNLKYYSDSYNKGMDLPDFSKSKIELQKIEDIYFCYNQGEVDDNKKAYLKLSNGLYITEINYSPQGVPADLLILNEKEFIGRTKELKENIKSYKKEIKNFR